jgi:hypothetical protein
MQRMRIRMSANLVIFLNGIFMNISMAFPLVL